MVIIVFLLWVDSINAEFRERWMEFIKEWYPK